MLDEPSANLDYHNTYVFRALVEKLKQEGYTVLIADHRFYYLDGLINRVFLFDEGKMQIFNSEELFKNQTMTHEALIYLRWIFHFKYLVKRRKKFFR